MAKKRQGQEVDILETLGDFTSKENWDKFFRLRGSGDSFEWYADWPSLRDPVLAQLSSSSSASSSSAASETVRILVPGCGSSRLSEYVYDAGFRDVTNIDFSKVAVSDMLRRHVRSRPEMKWRVMDMTQMQFADEFFDVILDKGGLDALMEPEHGIKLGSKYLKEVKRVLKVGGKFLCLTLAESHVIGLLFSEFRFGWETSIHGISQRGGGKPSFQTFMISVVKENLGAVKPVISLFDHSLDCNEKQVQALVNIVKEENQMRNECSSGANIIYSLQDLQLGAKGNLKELQPGRRFHAVLGEQGQSFYTYKTVLLDAVQQVLPFSYHCGVFIVPKSRAHEWLFTSEEGQWLVVESSKAARLIMVFLDSRHSHSSMDYIQKDLSPLVKGLAPGEENNDAAIPFMMASDGVKERNIVHQVMSSTTGPIIVEDVIYENTENENTNLTPSEGRLFRRLTFERSLGLVQSEALLKRDEPNTSPDEKERGGNGISSKSRKKGSRKKTDPRMSSNGLNINRSKSKVIYSKGCEESDELNTMLGISAGCLPVKYLGLPLSNQYPKATHFLPLIDKIRFKVDGWLSHSLSFAGRLEMIKSVIYSSLAYWYQTYFFPESIIKEIERICANFLWKGKMHHMSWRDVCKPKKEGGFGLRRLHDLCEAASLKLIWRLLTNKSLWSDWMRSRYFQNSNFWDSTAQPMDSGTWKNLTNLQGKAS